MNSTSDQHDSEHLDVVFLYALQALPGGEVPAAEAHIAACTDCQRELETLRPTIGSFVSWPTDVLRPPQSLWERLSRRIVGETGKAPIPVPSDPPVTQQWEEAAPGISVKILSTDAEKHRVSMLVRMAPGTDYPAHRHSGVEELHLLHGELMIDEKKLQPGDYIRAEADSVDHRVWSETGCTCILMTSTEDVLL